MTGALLGGAPVQQAARLQMVIMFMITASAAIAAVAICVGMVSVVVDAEGRVRNERVRAKGVRGNGRFVRSVQQWMGSLIAGIRRILSDLARVVGRGREDMDRLRDNEAAVEYEPLLGAEEGAQSQPGRATN